MPYYFPFSQVIGNADTKRSSVSSFFGDSHIEGSDAARHRKQSLSNISELYY